MGLPRTEYPSCAYPSAIPEGHGTAEVDPSIGKKYGSHVVIPCLYHTVNFPKLINIGWGISVSEPKFTSDVVKVVFRPEFPQTIGACIFLLIKGGDTPKILSFPSREGGH